MRTKQGDANWNDMQRAERTSGKVNEDDKGKSSVEGAVRQKFQQNERDNLVCDNADDRKQKNGTRKKYPKPELNRRNNLLFISTIEHTCGREDMAKQHMGGKTEESCDVQ